MTTTMCAWGPTCTSRKSHSVPTCQKTGRFGQEEWNIPVRLDFFKWLFKEKQNYWSEHQYIKQYYCYYSMDPRTLREQSSQLTSKQPCIVFSFSTALFLLPLYWPQPVSSSAVRTNDIATNFLWQRKFTSQRKSWACGLWSPSPSQHDTLKEDLYCVVFSFFLEPKKVKVVFISLIWFHSFSPS